MTLALPQPDDPVPSATRQPTTRARLQRVGSLPHPSRVVQAAKWWSSEGLLRLGVVLLKAPYLALREVPFAWVGLCRCASTWAAWVSVKDAVVKTAEHHSESHAKWVEQRRIGRRWVSGICLFTVTIACWWALVRHPDWLILAGVLLLVTLDAIGHRGRKAEPALPPPHRALAKEGVPLSMITEEVVKLMLREGREVGVAKPMRYDSRRQQYELWVTCLDDVTAEHCRAIERGTGFAHLSTRVLRAPGQEGGLWRLVIKEGDPLAVAVPAPFIPTGSVSITQRLVLGASVTDTPFALKLVGGHVKLIGTTSSGKTAWGLRNMIAALSACRDAVILGIDLSHGNEFSLWRGVVQRLARTEEEAEALLDEVLAEAARRGAILDGFAQDDDPANDHLTEWAPELGPFWVIIIDEFHMVAGCTGKDDSPDLLGKVKTIIKTVRKFGITLVMSTQETGNEDFGSKTMQTQAQTAIALPCAPADTVRLVGVERRDAGFLPHLLVPGTDDERHDAGKCYVSAPGMTEPDIYSFFAPMDPGEVKALARRRMADGLPAMYPTGSERPVPEVPGIVVDPLLAEVERALGGDDRIASTALVEHLRAHGYPEMSTIRLADLLRPHDIRPRDPSPMPDGSTRRGYYREDVMRAIEEGDRDG